MAISSLKKSYTEEQLMAKVATLFEEVEDVSSAEDILNMVRTESTRDVERTDTALRDGT